MDLVTLFAACAFGSGMPRQPIVRPVCIAPLALAAWNVMDQWEPLIAESSRRFGLPEAWIRSVMRAESGGLTMLNGRPITSRAGAMGLMQVMPETYEKMRLQLGLGGDPYDPHDNVLAGAAYLREMYDLFGYPDLFAAYNAGPVRLDSYLIYGEPLPQETLDYLARIGPGVMEIVLATRVQATASIASLAPSRRSGEGKIQSGQALFFAFDGASEGSSARADPMTAAGHPASVGGSIFVPRGDQIGRAPAASAGRLFVPLSHDRP